MHVIGLAVCHKFINGVGFLYSFGNEFFHVVMVGRLKVPFLGWYSYHWYPGHCHRKCISKHYTISPMKIGSISGCYICKRLQNWGIWDISYCNRDKRNCEKWAWAFLLGVLPQTDFCDIWCWCICLSLRNSVRWSTIYYCVCALYGCL